MTDFNPQIVRIEGKDKHPNADTLSIYTILGDYPIVDKTDKYQVGDLATYICIDAIVPDIEQFSFLSPKLYEKYEEDGSIKQRMVGVKYSTGSIPEKYRIVKAKKFFGIYSQGLLFPVIDGLKIGDSVIEVLGLKKYEDPDEEDNLMPKTMRGSGAESPPKGWNIPYYDINSIRKYLNCLQENEEIVLTEKCNGSYSSFCFDGEKLWVKSRNLYKKFDEDDPWHNAAIRYNLEQKLSAFPMLVFCGELIGAIKKYKYDAQIINGKLHTKLYFFDIYDVKARRYLDYDNFTSIIDQLELDRVPELYRGLWLGKDQMYPYAEGKSVLSDKIIREGFVLKSVKERYEPRLDSRLILKLVGESFNLNK